MERPQRKGIALCVPADEKKVANFPSTFLIQPKLNGERGIVIQFEKEPIILSSYQNPISTLDHITKEISHYWNLFGWSIPFDGEIYKHTWARERIDSALRSTVTKNKDVEELEFHVFDLNLPIGQVHRLSILTQLQKEIKSPFIKFVPTYQTNKDLWTSQADIFLQEGYEGAVLRNPLFPDYQPRRLVNQMLKYKPTETDEYEIISVKESISKDGEPLGMVGAFLVQGNDLEPFYVGAGKLSHSQRTFYWRYQNLLPGQTLITKQGKIKTSSGIPTCAVAVKVKD